MSFILKKWQDIFKEKNEQVSYNIELAPGTKNRRLYFQKKFSLNDLFSETLRIPVMEDKQMKEDILGYRQLRGISSFLIVINVI